MRYSFVAAWVMMLGIAGAGHSQAPASDLAAARAAHPAEIAARTHDGTAVPVPPAGVLQIIHYPSPAGALAAYVTPPPAGSGRHPAIIWISGGDCNSIGDFWTPQPADNDQTASAFRQAGIVMLYPSLRGGNDNPGYREIFYGEVDDVLAAADYLAALPYVDPARIYLGGHSTGGTLALLTAEADGRFRATFAFGPAEDVRSYAPGIVPVAITDPVQARLRSPGYWLASIRSPVFVLEGDRQANTASLRAMAAINRNPLVRFLVVPRATHFTILAPATALIARKILADTGPATTMAFDEAELGALLR